MDNKIIALLVAVVVVAGGASAFVILNYDGDNTDDSRFNVIARVNSEGSGIYIKEDLVKIVDGMPVNANNDTPFFTVEDDVWTVTPDNKDAWDGLVFGTPGPSTIQHTQLVDLAHKMGLEFKLAGNGTAKGAMYFDSGMSASDKIISSTIIDGGIIWEPQHQIVISNDKYTQLALTNDIFPDHTCCIIAGNEKYMKNNVEITERFLQGYVEAVKDINRILADPSSDDYKAFVAFVLKNVPSLSGDTDAAEVALSNITYLYADDENGDLSVLKTSIADLVVNLTTNGSITKDVTDPAAFADAFVDDTYLKGALTNEYEKKDDTTVFVAVITGDIHQIAIHWASEKDYFNGITIKTVDSTNGAGVAGAVVNGEAQFGFMGAPPATITTVNSGYITA
ncbi:MAG: hypothetical protein ACI4Q9_04555 [Candidatus Methanomethylophilaceae archaeon]